MNVELHQSESPCNDQTEDTPQKEECKNRGDIYLMLTVREQIVLDAVLDLVKWGSEKFMVDRGASPEAMSIHHKLTETQRCQRVRTSYKPFYKILQGSVGNNDGVISRLTCDHQQLDKLEKLALGEKVS